MSDPTLFPDEHDTIHAEDQLSPRARHLLLLGAVGLATLGFFIGIRDSGWVRNQESKKSNS